MSVNELGQAGLGWSIAQRRGWSGLRPAAPVTPLPPPFTPHPSPTPKMTIPVSPSPFLADHLIGVGTSRWRPVSAHAPQQKTLTRANMVIADAFTPTGSPLAPASWNTTACLTPFAKTKSEFYCVCVCVCVCVGVCVCVCERERECVSVCFYSLTNQKSNSNLVQKHSLNAK